MQNGSKETKSPQINAKQLQRRLEQRTAKGLKTTANSFKKTTERAGRDTP